MLLSTVAAPMSGRWRRAYRKPTAFTATSGRTMVRMRSVTERRDNRPSWVLPTTYILDRQGSIRYARLGPLEWDSAEVIDLLDRLGGDSRVGSD
jgi:hypothetical protein